MGFFEHLVFFKVLTNIHQKRLLFYLILSLQLLSVQCLKVTLSKSVITCVLYDLYVMFY